MCNLNELIRATAAQWRREWWLCLLVVTTWALFIALLVAMHEFKGMSYYDLTGDLSAVAKTRPWVGFISQFGLFFWSAAAACCLLAFAVHRGTSSPPSSIRFLLATGIFSGLLLVDDAFLLHEEVLPHFGIPEIAVYCGYMLLALAYICYFRGAHLASNYILLLGAMGGLGLSILSDATHLYLLDQQLFEDSFKLLGIIFWAAYCFSIARAGLHPASASSLPK